MANEKRGLPRGTDNLSNVFDGLDEVKSRPSKEPPEVNPPYEVEVPNEFPKEFSDKKIDNEMPSRMTADATYKNPKEHNEIPMEVPDKPSIRSRRVPVINESEGPSTDMSFDV